MRALAVLVALLTIAPVAQAQVGYDPARSPYRDLEKTHEVSVITGQWRASSDPAKVAPQTGTLFGLKYQWLMGGPANLTVDVSRVGSERRVLDPLLNSTCGVPPVVAADCKLIDTFRWPLYIAEMGLALNLTGARTFHGFVPEVRAGLGFLSDFHTRADVGDFAVGTRIVLSYGTGIRWVSGGRYQFRIDVGDRLYSVKYPEAYFTAAPDGSLIREPTCPSGITDNTNPLCRPAKRSAWLHNGVFTFGLSYLFGGT